MSTTGRSPQSIDAKALARIRKKGKGAVFVPGDFLDLGSREAIDLVFHRLVKKGIIRRLARGIYDVPRQHPTLGVLSPSIDAIAQALTGRGFNPRGPMRRTCLGCRSKYQLKQSFSLMD